MHADKLLLSRPVLVASLPDGGLDVTVDADPSERAAIAAANGLIDLSSLQGRFVLSRERAGQAVAVRGEVTARVVQTCTVTLDDFESAFREQVDVLFMAEEALAAWQVRADKKPEAEQGEDDRPDRIDNGRIDLGQLTAEFLVLGLDPHPRKPGVEFDTAAHEPEKDPSPFAVLSRLKGD